MWTYIFGDHFSSLPHTRFTQLVLQEEGWGWEQGWGRRNGE